VRPVVSQTASLMVIVLLVTSLTSDNASPGAELEYGKSCQPTISGVSTRLNNLGLACMGTAL
jgi:orotidine-5'-phosphate decarboxylase